MYEGRGQSDVVIKGDGRLKEVLMHGLYDNVFDLFETTTLHTSYGCGPHGRCFIKSDFYGMKQLRILPVFPV